MVGIVLVAGAIGASLTKRKLDEDAYFNRHLKASFNALKANRELAAEMALPMSADAFDVTWGTGPDMWPKLVALRSELTTLELWAPLSNYPQSGFNYADALRDIPDLEKRLDALETCTTCRSMSDLDAAAFSELPSTSAARGILHLLKAKTDEAVQRKDWLQAARAMSLSNHVAATAATGPNRDGLLTWAGYQLAVHRRMLSTYAAGQLEPERIELHLNYLRQESRAPDLHPAVNYEYFSRYWAAERIGKLNKEQITELVRFSPSEDVPPPQHPAATEALSSSVLAGWTTAVAGLEANPKNPRRAGYIADEPFVKAIHNPSDANYVLVTMDPVFEQTGTMVARALETRALAYAVTKCIEAEVQGRPMPPMSDLVPPQDDFDARSLVRTQTTDGWIISLEDTKNPAALPYGMTDRIRDNVLAFRWRTPTRASL